MTPDESPVGRIGTLSVATRGPAGPGEVLVKVRGGSEAFLAWSEQPIAKPRLPPPTAVLHSTAC